MANSRSNTKKIILSSHSSFCLVINDKSHMINFIKILILSSLLVNTMNMNIKATAKKKSNNNNYNSVFDDLLRHKDNLILNQIETTINSDLNHNKQIYDIIHLSHDEKNRENYSLILCFHDKDRLHNKHLYLHYKHSDYNFQEYQREYFNLLITKLDYTDRITDINYYNESNKNNSIMDENYIYILSFSTNNTIIKEKELKDSKDKIIISCTNHIKYDYFSFDTNIDLTNNTNISIISTNSKNTETSNMIEFSYFKVFQIVIVLGILINFSFKLNHVKKSNTIYSIYINFSFIIVIVKIILLLSSIFTDLFLFNISKTTTDKFVISKYYLFIQSLINVISTLLSSFILLLLVMVSNVSINMKYLNIKIIQY